MTAGVSVGTPFAASSCSIFPLAGGGAAGMFTISGEGAWCLGWGAEGASRGDGGAVGAAGCWCCWCCCCCLCRHFVCASELYSCRTAGFDTVLSIASATESDSHRHCQLKALNLLLNLSQPCSQHGRTTSGRTFE